MKIKAAILVMMVALSALPAHAVFYSVELPVEIRNGSFNYDYKTVPPGMLGGVPFDIPSTSNTAPYDYFAFYDDMPSTAWTVNGSSFDTLTLSTGKLYASTAYLLLNTNWGVPEFRVGTVTFNSLSGTNHYSIDLIGDSNIRDWNNWEYSNRLTDPAASEVFSVSSDFYDMTGRIDMLKVLLPDNFMHDPLSSIVFTDFGKDGESRVRVQGITIDAAVPEPSSAVLVVAGLASLAFGTIARRRKLN